MNQETKVFIGIGVITVAILIGAVFLFSKPQSVPQAADTRVVLGAPQQSVGPENSRLHLLSFQTSSVRLAKRLGQQLKRLPKPIQTNSDLYIATSLFPNTNLQKTRPTPQKLRGNKVSFGKCPTFFLKTKKVFPPSFSLNWQTNLD